MQISGIPEQAKIPETGVSQFVNSLEMQPTAIGQQWLFCSNISALPEIEISTANLHLYEMQDALENSDAKGFNQNKKALMLLLAQGGYKISSWQLLDLWVAQAELLRHVNFSDFDLSFVHLLNQQLVPLSLPGVHFNNAVLKHANFSGLRLEGADFTGADMRYINLEHSNLSGACMLGSNLSYSNLSHAVFTNANLYLAVLKESLARYAVFYNACLNGASLMQMDGFGIELSRADLENAKCKDACWFMGDLSDASVKRSDLRGANLQFANLFNVQWTGALTQGLQLSREAADYYEQAI